MMGAFHIGADGRYEFRATCLRCRKMVIRSAATSAKLVEEMGTGYRRVYPTRRGWICGDCYSYRSVIRFNGSRSKRICAPCQGGSARVPLEGFAGVYCAYCGLTLSWNEPAHRLASISMSAVDRLRGRWAICCGSRFEVAIATVDEVRSEIVALRCYRVSNIYGSQAGTGGSHVVN